MVQRTQDRELPGYARTLVSDVLNKTGYPLLVVEDDGVNYDSQLRMAGTSQPYHLLSIMSAYWEHGLHFLVGAAFKIQRVWALLPEERLMPVSPAARRLPEEEEAELREKVDGLPEAAIIELSTFLYRGMTQQLTSMPLDIRVEREIAGGLPEHREVQHSYLSRQVQDLEPHFQPEIAEFSPAHLYAASTAMNVALAEEAAQIAGVEPGPMFRQTPHLRLGERLREQLEAVEELGYSGDRIVTDGWADELGMRDWYEWRRLDEVR